MTPADVLATIDHVKFAAINARHGADVSEDRRQKYLDLPKWIAVNMRRVRALGLDRGKPRRVLDLGCGCGYFLYVCKLFGHSVTGLDRPEQSSLYTDMRDLLGIPTVEHAIKPFEPLPAMGAFDLVTAHMVTFNGHRSRPWGVDEWAFLISDLRMYQHARTVYLELNAEPDGTLYPPGLREWFEARGTTNAHRVLIDR